MITGTTEGYDLINSPSSGQQRFSQHWLLLENSTWAIVPEKDVSSTPLFKPRYPGADFGRVRVLTDA
jgi:hypothetical protein